MQGQINLFDTPLKSSMGCGECLCASCLMYHSCRCPYGECYDGHRAKTNAYDAAHPGQPPRTQWSTWKTDQAYWCRGGIFYPAVWCEHYIPYRTNASVKTCLECNVMVYQDGYILCPIVDSVGCEACYKRFEDANG